MNEQSECYIPILFNNNKFIAFSIKITRIFMELNKNLKFVWGKSPRKGKKFLFKSAKKLLFQVSKCVLVLCDSNTITLLGRSV